MNQSGLFDGIATDPENSGNLKIVKVSEKTRGNLNFCRKVTEKLRENLK